MSLQLQPQKRGSFTVYQNVHAQIGKDSYEYSEAWSLNTTKSQQDLFSIPPGPLRESTYECHADTWIEEGGIDPAQCAQGVAKFTSELTAVHVTRARSSVPRD